MKPKWQPIPLPGSFASNAELAFQPFLDKEKAVVVTGGPAALYLVKVNENARLLCTITARARISGFAVHAGEVFVQDGPVLSRWDLTRGLCSAAINLLNPRLVWQTGDGTLDWAKLHALTPALTEKQVALAKARRKLEWLTLLESSEALLRDSAAPRSPDEEAKLRAMIADLVQLVGTNREQVRADLEAAENAGAAIIFSVPVVRKNQVGAKLGALVYVIARDGTLHPLDDALQHMGTVRVDNNARPALAMFEWQTAARSDDHASRVFYVTGDGLVRAIDGNSLPPRSAAEWPSRGRSGLQAGIRPRVEGGLLWGSDAQGSGVYALPVNAAGSSSRITLPASQKWLWLETTKAGSLALACTERDARLVSYTAGAPTIERWGARPAGRPYYSSFLETDDRPLLVAEFEREAATPNMGTDFRVVVANTDDAPDANSVSKLLPPPTIASGQLEPMAVGKTAPVSIRTQVTVSLQDAYLVARDRSASDQIRALLVDGSASWRAAFDKIVVQYDNVQAAAAALGQVALPALAGSDALYCYSIGTELTDEQIATARAMQKRFVPITLQVMRLETIKPGQMGPGPPLFPPEPQAVFRRDIRLRFSNGESMDMMTSPDGWITVPPDKLGLKVTLDSIPFPGSVMTICDTVLLDRKTGLRLQFTTFDRWL